MGAGAVENQLWQQFSAEACPELPSPVHVTLLPHQMLLEPGAPVLFVYFPLTAVVSLVSMTGAGESTQVALVGREGLVGLTGIFGCVEGSTTTQVLVPGTALRLPAAAVRTARAACVPVRRALDAYTQARLIQTAQAAVCNRLHTVDARLSRWLLELHERVEGDQLRVSHERIADLLGVHRPTVSTSMHALQQQGAVTQRGRTIVITDRALLERLTCECHGTLVRDLERAFAPIRHGSAPSWRSDTERSTQGQAVAHASIDTVREIAGRLLRVSLREQEARERAEAANLAKDLFLSTISHELRTPLNAILGWCAILREEPAGEVERGLQVIERSARAQWALVNELLDSVRISSGTLALQRLPVSMAELVRNAVDAMSPDARAKKVGLHLEVPTVLESVHGDADRLSQVLRNVLHNALKFTPGGGSIHVRVDTSEGRARIVVRDSGVGIAPALLPRLFERFRRGPAELSAEAGLGLGLAISRAVIDLHGGTIVLESDGKGHGTTCTVQLPLLIPTEPVAIGPKVLTSVDSA